LSRDDPTRRHLIAAAAALPIAACDRSAQSQPASRGPAPSLRAIAPFAVGTCIQTSHIQDPAFTALLTRQFSQITPEWEMKMERIVRDDGSFDFSAADAIAGFARDNHLRPLRAPPWSGTPSGRRPSSDWILAGRLSPTPTATTSLPSPAATAVRRWPGT